MQEIPARLEADGWDAVRPAISTTVMCIEEAVPLCIPISS